MTVIPTTLDLTPSTRILPILGEIRLDLWQCLAELIDNPVDAFLNAARVNAPLENPEVRVSLPTNDSPTGRITVRDNGPGMDLATLNLAVRAGWTSNNPNDNLGLFGMGFNIATARLANHTRILSARAGDAEYTGVEIDFDKMRQQAHFEAPVVTAPKADPSEHGTIIEISNIKPEQRQAIAKPTTLAAVKKRLGRVYSAMLQANGAPVHFNLFINGQIVKPIRHCVWGDNRIVQTSKFGPVHAFMPLNYPLAPRKFCSQHLEWLPPGTSDCASCGNATHVQERMRKITGWIGIQRYLSETEYGIDLLRNGRKIEVDNRDLFMWDNEGVIETEYPIDDIGRPKGRIVGEIHLDHGHVNYTKDRFDRNDPSWPEMVELVHGRGPLRPEKAKEASFPVNNAPLSMLFSTFRRSSPKPVVAGSWEKLLVVKSNDLAREYATKFQQGDPEFETDERWFKLVQEQDQQLLTGTGGAPTPAPPAPPTGGAFPTPNGTPGATPAPAAPAPAPEPPRTEMLALSRKYHDDHSRREFNVKAFSCQPADPELNGQAWATKSNASGDHLFYFDLSHQIYQSVTFTPLDALLAELAAKAYDSQRTTAGASFTASLTALRAKYATEFELNEQALVSEANRVLNDIAGSLSRNLAQEDARSMFYQLPQAQQDAIHQKMLAARVHDPLELMSNGRFLEFAKRTYISTFVSEHPELFFDGKYWDVRYANFDYGSPAMIDAAKAEVIKTYSGWLEDAAWLSETEGGALIGPNRDRLLRASMSLRLLSESIATTEEA